MWVDCFDQGKGPKYLARILVKLPDEFHAFMVIGLETLPGPVSGFMSQARALGGRAQDSLSHESLSVKGCLNVLRSCSLWRRFRFDKSKRILWARPS